MKLPESLFSRMFLAYLPLAAYPFGLFKTSIAVLWIVLFLWSTVTFFWFTRRFFPGRTLRPAFFLWLLVWTQAVWTLSKLPPVWILSVFFLMPLSFLDDTVKARSFRLFSKEVPRYFFERVLAGVGFAGFVMLMTLAREVSERRLGMRLFEQPAGFLLLSAALAFLWKNQPYGKRPQEPLAENETGVCPAVLAEQKKRSGRG